jgi:hypothetical protein
MTERAASSAVARGRNLARRVRRRWAEKYAFPDLVVVGRDIPDVGECHVHRDGSTCAQCDGSHVHEWSECVVLNKNGGFIGKANRCRVCGARKCDNAGCQGRRHHEDAHIYASGRVQAVGS